MIVGAGIGGLAAGVVLRRAGWDVRILERASSPRELGFALALAPNALAPCARSASPTPSIRDGAEVSVVRGRGAPTAPC